MWPSFLTLLRNANRPVGGNRSWPRCDRVSHMHHRQLLHSRRLIRSRAQTMSCDTSSMRRCALRLWSLSACQTCASHLSQSHALSPAQAGARSNSCGHILSHPIRLLDDARTGRRCGRGCKHGQKHTVTRARQLRHGHQRQPRQHDTI